MNSDRAFQMLVPFLRRTATRRRAERRASFRAEAVPPGAAVFLGDSITELAPLTELFPELTTSNRGIGWDTTQDLLARVDDALNSPAVVSVLIGTNDLHTSRQLRKPDGIVQRLETIVEHIQRAHPATPVLVNGLLPRTALFAPRLQALNARYRAVAERTGAHYVDVWPALADANGAIRAGFATDNLHLTPAGYRAWGDVLRPLLRSAAS